VLACKPGGLGAAGFMFWNKLATAVKRVERGAGGEVLFLDLLPATENILDVHQADFRELLLEFGDDLRVMDTVAEFGCDALPFLRIEEVEIGLCQVTGTALVDHLVDNGDREFRKQADRGNDTFELVGA